MNNSTAPIPNNQGQTLRFRGTAGGMGLHCGGGGGADCCGGGGGGVGAAPG